MKREPLLSGDVIPVKLRSPEEVDAMHEKARAKDAELIQRLVDASSKIRHWHDAHDGGMIVSGDSVRGLWSALSAADARGFKPTEQ